tara:strand:- start:77 stop:280 length:204 start_codon:yes stop_codon:yes gene_type:complete
LAELDRIFLSTAHNSALFHTMLARRGILDAARLQISMKDGSELKVNVFRCLEPLLRQPVARWGKVYW